MQVPKLQCKNTDTFDDIDNIYTTCHIYHYIHIIAPVLDSDD